MFRLWIERRFSRPVTAAGAVLKPQGGNCAVLPLIINECKNQPPAVQMHKAGGWFYKS